MILQTTLNMAGNERVNMETLHEAEVLPGVVRGTLHDRQGLDSH